MSNILEMKTSMLFSLDFAGNSILSCFFLLFLIIDLHVLIPAVTGQTFNQLAEFLIPLGIPNKEANAETEISTDPQGFFQAFFTIVIQWQKLNLYLSF